MRREYKNILVTQTGGWIGDMVLLTPALRALRKTYPDAHIAMLLSPIVAGLMAEHPYLDELIVYDKRRENKGFCALWRLAQSLRRTKFDLAVVLHPNSVRSALISYLAHIPERIGTRISGRGIFLTKTVVDRTDIHEVERYLRILKLIGVDEPDRKLEFWHTPEDSRTCYQLLEQAGSMFYDDCIAKANISGKPSDLLVGINPGTTWQSKRWGLERFAQIITVLVEEFQVRIILTGAPSEKALGDELRKLTSSDFINLIGKTTLLQLGALIERFALYITCDSGPMHIAAAVNTPTIALFGPTSPTRHRPYGHGHVVIQKHVGCPPCYERICKRHHECMDAIAVDDVMAVFKKIGLMSKTSAR